MPDLAMCSGGACLLKEECYRHRAKPTEFRQSYFGTPPFKGDDCEYFYDLKGWPPSYVRTMAECTAAEERIAKAQKEHEEEHGA